MSKKYSRLFEPCAIGSLTIKNRISMAPMGLAGYSDVNGAFNSNAQEYYVERAKGGTGLIITGVCCVDYTELPLQSLPCPTYNPLQFLKSTKPMNERIHSYDTKIFLQLTGGLGRSALPGVTIKEIAPSTQKNRFNPGIIHREMTIKEIQNLIQNFVKSSVTAKQSGFDGVEIHAVHEGYLLDQFSIAFYNNRTDEYGGDLKGRLRLATDIVQGIKKACGSDFPVSLRFSLKSFIKDYAQGALPGEEFEEKGRDVEEGIQAAGILVEAGYDCLNVDAGTYDSWYWNHPPMYFEKGMYREFGRIVKEHVDVPVILAGRMDDPDMAVSAIGHSCDLISLGRPLLADPCLPQKIRMEKLEDIRPCLSCHDGCMGRIAAMLPLSCAVNPQCGREKELALIPSLKVKKVLIAGGGLAGMEAARVCAIRGHEVIICEKTGELGGNLIYGSVPEFKKDDKALLSWYKKQLKDLDVTVCLNTEIDAKAVEDLDVEVIITSTGSKPVILNFGDSGNVVTAEDVLGGKCQAGQDVVIIGGGLVGCETALWLKNQGKNVTVVEIAPYILGGPHGMPFMNQDMLKDLLHYHQVTIYTEAKVQKVTGDFVAVRTCGGEVRTLKADMVITAVGYSSCNQLYLDLKESSKEVYNIGDSRKVHNIMGAIWDGFQVASGI